MLTDDLGALIHGKTESHHQFFFMVGMFKNAHAHIMHVNAKDEVEGNSP